MAKRVLPVLAVLALVLPAVASAEIIRADLRGEHASLVRIDGKGKHKNKHGGRHHRDYDDDRDERRAYRQGYRDGRRRSYGQEYYRPGYAYDGYERRRYSRGQYLPHEYRSYVVYDYDRYGYPPPPRGCRYVQVGQDTYLTQIATGLILSAFLGGGY